MYPTGLFPWRGQTNRGVLQGSGMDLKTVQKGRWKPRLQLGPRGWVCANLGGDGAHRINALTSCRALRRAQGQGFSP